MSREFIFVIMVLILVPTQALAEGFSQAQFGLLVLVNLALGAILTLFIGVLISVFLRKFKSERRVETPVEGHKTEA